MTVAELITELQQYPADLPVVISQPDYETGIGGEADIDTIVLDSFGNLGVPYQVVLRP